MKAYPICLIALSALLSLNGLADAQIYKWIDAEGRVHYSNVRPGPPKQPEPEQQTATPGQPPEPSPPQAQQAPQERTDQVSQPPPRQEVRRPGETASQPPPIVHGAGTVEVRFDKRIWKVGFRTRQGRTGLLVEYVLEGETVENWSELVTYEYLRRLQEKSLEELIEQYRRTRMRQFPGIVWNVIRKSDKDLMYEWKIERDPRVPDQYYLTRAVLGRDGFHLIFYASKQANLPSERRQEWITLLNSARIVE